MHGVVPHCSGRKISLQVSVPLPHRRVALQHVLLPGLRFAPPSFQAAYLAQRMPQLAALLTRPARDAPGLLCAPQAFHIHGRYMLPWLGHAALGLL